MRLRRALRAGDPPAAAFLLAVRARNDARRARHGDRRRRPGLPGQALLRRRLASAGRRRRDRRDLLEALARELRRGGQYRDDRRAAAARRVFQQARCRGATMSCCTSCANSVRTGRRCPTTRSSRTDSSRADALPEERAAPRARASPKCSQGRGGRAIVVSATRRKRPARSCGAAKSSCGPTGTMPVGLTCRWLM